MELSNVLVSVQANDWLITRGGPCTRTTVEPFGRVFLNGHVCSYSARRSLSRNTKVLECSHEHVFFLFFFVISPDLSLFLYFLFFPSRLFYFKFLRTSFPIQELFFRSWTFFKLLNFLIHKYILWNHEHFKIHELSFNYCELFLKLMNIVMNLRTFFESMKFFPNGCNFYKTCENFI